MKPKDIFPDKTLAKIVAKNLGISVDDVNGKQGGHSYSKITQLKYFGADKIESIEGLQFLENLEELHFSNNNISDLSPLKNLKKLEILYFANNKINDITPLANLEKLWVLDLCENPVKNLSSLANKSFLRQMRLGTKCDITTLPLLSYLKSLEIVDNPLEKFVWRSVHTKPYSHLKLLNEFIRYNDKLKDYSFVANLPDLRTFNFPRCQE